jgi:hypothetical protein
MNKAPVKKKPKVSRVGLARSLAVLAGFIAMAAGLWMKDPPWALIVMGGLLAIGAIFGQLLERRNGIRRPH